MEMYNGVKSSKSNEEIITAQLDVIHKEGELIELQKQLTVIKTLGARLEKDGNQWCFITGNLEDLNSIAGFGDTPKDALADFYRMFKTGKTK